MARLLFFSGVLVMLFGSFHLGSLMLFGAFTCGLGWVVFGPKGHWL